MVASRRHSDPPLNLTERSGDGPPYHAFAP